MSDAEALIHSQHAAFRQCSELTVLQRDLQAVFRLYTKFTSWHEPQDSAALILINIPTTLLWTVRQPAKLLTAGQLR